MRVESGVKEKIFSWIDGASSLAAELETELTKRPAISPDSGGKGELDKCNFLQGWLKAQGITQLERYDAPDSRAKGGIRPNLLATIRGNTAIPETGRLTSRGRLWIISHLDVVPPGELSLWTGDPWTVREVKDAKGHRLIGRGTEDNQQGMVSSILAALAFVKLDLQPGRTVKLLFAADEETGSELGINWLIKNYGNLFQKNDIALIPDSGDTEGSAVEIAEKNLIWARFLTKGTQCHGSRPDQGVNAHLAGAELALRLHYRLSEKFGEHDPLFEPDYSTFQPTKKEANVPNINTIPGEDVFCMDMRILPCYSVRSVLDEIDCIKQEVAGKHGVTIEYGIVQSSESPATAREAPLVQSLSAAIDEVYRVKSRPIGIGGGTVAASLRRMGIDCAVWSRLGDCAHQPDEFALLENIIGDAKVMAVLMGK